MYCFVIIAMNTSSHFIIRFTHLLLNPLVCYSFLFFPRPLLWWKEPMLSNGGDGLLVSQQRSGVTFFGPCCDFELTKSGQTIYEHNPCSKVKLNLKISEKNKSEFLDTRTRVSQSPSQITSRVTKIN